MIIWTILVILVVAFLITLYFVPYKTLKGKIFKKIYPDTLPVSRVLYKGSGFTVEFKRNNDNWQMISPVDWQADTNKMRNLMVKLSLLDVNDRLSGKNPLDSEYSIGRNGVLELEANGKVVSLSFGSMVSQEELVYVVKSDDGDVLTVHSSIVAALPKSADDFKRMTLFEDIYTSIRTAEAVVEGKGFLIMRTDVGWIANGKNSFDEQVLPFLEGLTELRATGFAKKDIQLPAKHHAFISVKASAKTISRYFFESDEYEDSFLVPLNGEVLLVDKNEAQKYFSFK